MRVRRLLFPLCLLGFACTSDGLGPIPLGKYVSVSGGFRHTCAVTTEDVGMCWGDNAVGQIGNGALGTIDSLPSEIHGPVFFTHITTGDRQSCGIMPGGDAYCWGTSQEGALGSDTATVSAVPIPVSGGLKFKAISAGSNFTCGLTTVGVAYCWGQSGMLGTDTTDARTPVAVAGGHTYTAIAAAQYHACAIAVGGAAYCWGAVEHGALGTGDSIGHVTPAPVTGGHKFKVIAVANGHTCAITTGGAAYCWGIGWFGDLGNGAMTDQYAPVPVSGSHTYDDIAVGANHSCALETGGQLFCWGNNGDNQLAGAALETCIIGPTPANTVPCTSNPITSASGHLFRSITAGAFHTCAIAQGGGAFCWGANNRGAIGNYHTGASVATPYEVPEPTLPPPPP